MITEKNNVFYCDCGFSFQRGRSGDHNCAEGLRIKLAESEARCAALAAENAGLAAELQSVKAMNDCLSEELRGYESDGAFEGPKMHLLWWQCETPNHDAILAEVRAQGVEMFASVLQSRGRHQGYVEIANAYAAQLRKGVQS